MKTLAYTLIGAAAAIGFAMPAMAQDVPQSAHGEDHEQLGDQHGNVHGQLGEIHEGAHEDGVAPWEHQGLHQQLGRAHARADSNIQGQHELQDDNQGILDGRRANGYGSHNGGYSQGYGSGGYGQDNGYYGDNARRYHGQHRARPVIRYRYDGQRRY